MYLCKASLTKTNFNFVLFTGNYFNSHICSRVLYKILGSWLSKCLCRNQRKIALCCADIFYNRYDVDQFCTFSILFRGIVFIYG